MMKQRLNGGPQLPKVLRDQIGVDITGARQRGLSRSNTPFTRKDRRKAERHAKKTHQYVQPKSATKHTRVPPEPQPPTQANGESSSEEDGSSLEESPQKDKSVSITQSQKLPKEAIKRNVESDKQRTPKISRAVKDKLAQDDAEISALEKRLGIKGKKKSKHLDDGLDDVLGDLGGFESEDEDLFAFKKHKRKRDEDDDWLASKRRGAIGDAIAENPEQKEVTSGEDLDLDSMDSDEELDLDEALSEGKLVESNNGMSEESDFEGFDESAKDKTERPPIKENPYVAPVAADTPRPAKYIPPALRAPPSTDSEALSRLRRQIQGLLNRLSDANVMTILRDVEAIYQNNPRGYVTSIVIDLLIGLLADETVLLDTFLILHAGFIAAIYKVIGPDFGAQMIERIVSEFDRSYQRNKEGVGKQTTNLISVVAELYCFQTIGSKIIFDYLRRFLGELSEIHTELILRIVRVAGSQLRQDDPSSLKDIVLLLQKQVTKAREGDLSVRTKFMVETINDLKNNKMKTGIAASAVASEHVVRMKKQLGTLNSHNLKGSEPLRIGLDDIKDTEKKGKWWLVGASWRNDAVETEEALSTRQQARPGEPDLSEQTGEVDLFQLAREQRMNTDVRRAIFITIMSASDYKDAHVRLLKLNLKKAQETEIPRVIVHCAGCENTYNPYYTLLAQKFSMDHRSRKCFQFALWDVFKSLGETKDGGDEGDSSADEGVGDGQAGELSLRKLVNLGKLYGTLIARDALSITTLKPLNFPYLKAKTVRLVEIMLVTAILESQKKAKDKKDTEKKRDHKAVLNVFINVDGAPEMVAGLQYFLKNVVGKTEITANKREKECVRWACKLVTDMLERLMTTTTLDED